MLRSIRTEFSYPRRILDHLLTLALVLCAACLLALLWVLI